MAAVEQVGQARVLTPGLRGLALEFFPSLSLILLRHPLCLLGGGVARCRGLASRIEQGCSHRDWPHQSKQHHDR